MAQMNMIEAIRSALDVVMDNDPNVVVLGQDIVLARLKKALASLG